MPCQSHPLTLALKWNELVKVLFWPSYTSQVPSSVFSVLIGFLLSITKLFEDDNEIGIDKLFNCLP